MKQGWTGGQYSLFRVLFGAYLLVHFAHLLPWSAEIFSSAGMLNNAELSPLFGIFPNILKLGDAPLAVQGLTLSAVAAALAFIIGWRDKLAALWLWYVLACLFTRNPLIANPALPYVGWMLLAHLFIPGNPYGSVAAIGRENPAGEWFMPRAIFIAGTVVLALSYSYSGYTKLLSPSWVNGQTLAYVLDNPLARDGFLRDFFLSLPAWLLSSITWFILYVELLYAPLALIPRLRPWLWLGMLLVQFGFLFLLNFPDLTIGMLLFHLFTFDPEWLPKRSSRREVIFYDGHCGLCHRVIRFVLAEDLHQHFRFAPLDSAYFREQVPVEIRQALPDTFVVYTADRKVLMRSDAAIHLLKALGGLWLPAGLLLQLIPKPLRDAGYRLIGTHRQRFFARPENTCPLMPAGMKTRFIGDAQPDMEAA